VKTIKDDPNKKLSASFMNRKSESDLKAWKHSAKNEMVGGRFLFYAAVL